MASRLNTFVIVVSAGAICFGVHDSVAQEAQTVDISLESQIVPSPVEISILLPPGYSESTNPFPMLLALHGGGGSRGFNKALYESLWTKGDLPELVAGLMKIGFFRPFFLSVNLRVFVPYWVLGKDRSVLLACFLHVILGYPLIPLVETVHSHGRRSALYQPTP